VSRHANPGPEPIRVDPGLTGDASSGFNHALAPEKESLPLPQRVRHRLAFWPCPRRGVAGRRTAGRAVLSLVALLCVGTGVPRAAAAQGQLPDGMHVSIFAGVQSFRWQEFLDGARVVKETGPMLSLGASVDNLGRAGKGLLFSVEGAIYGGTVDYDGQTQDGVDAQTDAEYSGAYLDGLLGYRVFSIEKRYDIDVLGGLGLDSWDRDIAGGTDALGRQVRGIAEDYQVVSGRVGLGLQSRWARWTGYLQLGLKRPLRTQEEITRLGVTLEPKSAPSVFGSLSLDRLSSGRRTFGLVLYYESYRFDESPPEPGSLGGSPVLVFQPESKMDVVGLRLRHAL